MFARIFRRSLEPRATRHMKRHFTVEALEHRQLMTVVPQFPIYTNSHYNLAIQSANASSSNGSSVAVWTDFGYNGTQIMGQLFNPKGGKVGPVLNLVGSENGPDFDEQPSVAMNAQGGFVVSWTQVVPNEGIDILAQQFNARGAQVGGVVGVGVGTFEQTSSSVAMDAKGDFAVSYTRDTNNDNPDIFAKLYNTNGQLLNVVSVATTSEDEDMSSIAMSPNGEFDIAWQVQSGASAEVMAARYTASGNLLERLVVANSAPSSNLPKVAMDKQGNAVIAYQTSIGDSAGHTDVEANRLSNTGVLSGAISIGGITADVASARPVALERDAGPSYLNTEPIIGGPTLSVALEGSGGAFAVAYDSYAGVDVTEVSSSNVVINSGNMGSTTSGPAISINAQNELLVTYTETEFPGNTLPGTINTWSIAGRWGRL